MPVKKTYELLIQGNVSEKELVEIDVFLQHENIKVNKFHTKELDIREFIQLVLSNFDEVVFVRDFMLGSLLSFLFSNVEKVIEYFSKREKKISNVTIKINCINVEGNALVLHIITEPGKMEDLITLLNKKNITDVLNNIKGKRSVYITINKQNQLEINMK